MAELFTTCIKPHGNSVEQKYRNTLIIGFHETEHKASQRPKSKELYFSVRNFYGYRETQASSSEEKYLGNRNKSQIFATSSSVNTI